MFRKTQLIHFVGIGGIGMSGIAEVLLNQGYRVSGSDLHESEALRRLQALGARVHVGHAATHLEGADVVVVSSAVPMDNVEVVAARERLIPVIPRAEMLAELMRMKYGVAVAGSHGKTTTTSMIATVLATGGMDPTVVIGGKVNSLGGNAKLGQGEFLVAEADESDGSFLKLSPTIAVATSLDREHLDHYGDFAALSQAFLTFLNRIPFYGVSVLCLDQPELQALIPGVGKRYLTYGLTSQADYTARQITFDGTCSSFTAYHHERELGQVTIHMPGRHNVSNALAAIAVGLEVGLDFPVVRKALEEFSGVQRRFQIKGETGGVMVVDDYGHHPTEIKATLKAAREGWSGRRLVVVFQPHRYTRTRDLFQEFLTAFYEADLLILTQIYGAGEQLIEGVDAEQLYEGIKRHGHRQVRYRQDKGTIPSLLLELVKPGDLVLTLGAGDIWRVGEVFLERLMAKGREEGHGGGH